MDEYSETFKNIFSKLDPSLQNFITDPDFEPRIENLVKDQPLQKTQVDAFATEVILVLLKIQDLQSFTANIKQNMEISMKRAEDISKKTKQEIFSKVEEHLLQKPLPVVPTDGKVASDGIASPTNIGRIKKLENSSNQIHNEIPLKDVEIPKKDAVPEAPHPIVAPVPEEVIPTAKEKVLSSPEAPEKPSDDSLDIFKKRLEQPVHTPVEENQIGDVPKKIVGDVDPSVKEAIANDPYKESI